MKTDSIVVYFELREDERKGLTKAAAKKPTAKSAVASDGFSYSVNDGIVKLIGYKGKETRLVIPREIEGNPVSSIDPQFSSLSDNQSSIREIVIPDSVHQLCARSFCAFNNLSAFFVDSNNPQFTSEDGVIYNKTMTELVCCPCNKAGFFAIPDSVTRISDYVFVMCRSLIGVSVPNGVTEINDGTFFHCKNLKQIAFSEKVKHIGQFAFSCCESLTGFFVETSNLSFSTHDGVLYNKEKTTLVRFPLGKGGRFTVPDGVERIEPFAFFQCDELTEVTVSNGVLSIGRSAFCDADSLRIVNIPKSVRTIEADAFSLCSNLKDIVVSEDNKNYLSIDGVLFERKTRTLVRFPQYSGSSYTVPPFVAVIGEGAFSGCALKDIQLPGNLREIKPSAFEHCNRLEKIYIPDSVTEIGENAFKDCTELRIASLPKGLKTVKKGLFYHCTLLHTVYIPKSVSHISWDAFFGCQNVKLLVPPHSDAFRHADSSNLPFELCDNNPFENERKQNIAVVNDFVYQLFPEVNSTSAAVLQYKGNKPRAVIPEKVCGLPVTELIFGAFAEANNLVILEIPKSIKRIGVYDHYFTRTDAGMDFSNYARLKAIAVDNGSVTFKSREMCGLFNYTLKTLIACANAAEGNYTVPHGTKTVEKFAFANCTRLRCVTIPDTVTAIADSAFENCKNITILAPKGSFALKYAQEHHISALPTLYSKQAPLFKYDVINDTHASITGYENVGISSNGRVLSYEEVIIPSYLDGYEVTMISKDAFAGNVNWTKVTIPDTVFIISHRAFANCENMKEIFIPDSVRVIDEDAFKGCGLLTIVTPKGSYASTVRLKSGRFRKIPVRVIDNAWW